MTFTCKEARPLVASYADGELSEAQAGLLRRHLLECSGCRRLAQDEKALKRWFVAAAAPAVPEDFAARVVRRAFAGDTGEHGFAPAPVLEVGRLRGFVTTLTGLAAAAAILIAVAIRQSDLPAERGLRADQVKTYEEVRHELEQLEAHEAHPAAEAEQTGTAEPVDPSDPAREDGVR